MKPLKIRIQAFGPFAGVQDVDFAELGGRSFFLIHGPTGAGKTTLLDAMCFALYGDTSGGERDARAMRSDHADPELPTKVSLDFALGERRYRVTRTPQQSRLSQRGGVERMVAVAASAELEEWRDGGWQPLVQQTRQVNDKVCELIGFSSEQFRQLIVLPQGRFRELLTADTKARQVIMERLFSTELYSRIEVALKYAAAGLVERTNLIREQRAGILNQVELAGDEALNVCITERRQALTEAEQKEAAARESARNAQQALELGRAAAAKLAEREAAVVALTTLRERDAGEAARRERIQLAERAGRVQEAATQLQRSRQEQQKAAVAVESARQLAQQAATKAEAAREAFEREGAREPERRAADQAIHDLETAARAWQQWQQAQLALRQSQGRFETLRDQVEKLQRERKSLGDTLAGMADSALALQAQAVSAGAIEAEAGRLAERHEQLQALQQAEALQRKHSTAVAGVTARVGQAQAAVDAARSARSACEQGWVAGQAARLAALLNHGEACPVCGGLEHPAPAHAATVVEDDALEAARNACTRAENALGQAQNELLAAQGALGQADARVEALRASLGDLATQSPDALQAGLDDVRRRLAEAKRAASELADLEARRKAAQMRLTALEPGLAQAEPALQDARSEVDRLGGQAQAGFDSVPEALRAEGAMERALNGAKQARDALFAALDRARTQHDEASRQRSASEATLHAASAAADDALRNAGLANEAFEASLAQQAFADVPAWQAALLPAEVLASEQAHASRYAQQLASAQDRMTRADEAASGLVAPDLVALDAVVQAASLAMEEVFRIAEGLRHALDELVRAREKLDALAGESSRIEAEYAVLGRISEIANGRNSRNMSFQRYVLATLLDEVLEAASLRLRRMSRGRYELRRMTGQGDKRLAGGLDLEVFDHETGSARPANTLSGGEGFLASLSLALGLADVVQSRAGGIQLETLFVDEGFGTLDPESLDFAINTLVDLQQGGRLVGIISHVAELRERIDVRLEVKPAAKGSAIAFVI